MMRFLLFYFILNQTLNERLSHLTISDNQLNQLLKGLFTTSIFFPHLRLH